MQDFEKFKARALFMPVWEWSKIEAAVEIFPRVTVDAAKELFAGVVRAVLALAHLPRSETALDAALSDASPERILQQIGQPSQEVHMGAHGNALHSLCFKASVAWPYIVTYCVAGVE